MWLGKWFNRHRDEENDEPARFSAPQIVRPPEEEPATQSNGATNKPAKLKPATGFDPYNSGAFERRNAWERIHRR